MLQWTAFGKVFVCAGMHTTAHTSTARSAIINKNSYHTMSRCESLSAQSVLRQGKLEDSPRHHYAEIVGFSDSI